MRCRNKNCRIKLDKTNSYTLYAYDEGDLNSDTFSGIKKAIKIKVCIECAKMYLGKYFDEEQSFDKLTHEMEFSKEFQQDIFNKIRN